MSNKDRPNLEPAPNREGVRVRMSAAKNYTAKHILKHPFIFQCPPLETFAWQQEYGWTDYETIRRGTFSRPSAKGLRSVQFQTLFVDYDAYYAVVRPQGRWTPNPIKLARELREVMNEGTPFKLQIGQSSLWYQNDLEMMATLRSMSIEERAGEVDARYADLSFVEYRDIDIDRMGEGSGEGEKFPQIHKVKFGDTLRSLSKHYYGNYSNWKLIAKANPSEVKGVPPDQNLATLKRPVRTLKIPKPPGSIEDFEWGDVL